MDIQVIFKCDICQNEYRQSARWSDRIAHLMPDGWIMLGGKPRCQTCSKVIGVPA